MHPEIKTLQLTQLHKTHPLRHEMVILPVTIFFEMNIRYTALKNRFYAVFLFKEGKGTVGIDNREFEIVAGRIFFINYHQVYYFREFSAEGHVLMFTKSFYNHVYTGNRLIRSDRILTDVPAFSDIKNSSGKNLLKSFELLQGSSWKTIRSQKNSCALN